MTSPNDRPRADGHPLVVELFKLCPPVGSHWPMNERALWFDAMNAVLSLIYPHAGERVAIGLEPEGSAVHVVRSSLTAADVERMRAPVMVRDPSSPVVLDPRVKPAVVPAPTLIGSLTDYLPDEPQPRIDEVVASISPAGPGRWPKSTSPGRPEGIPTNLEMVLQVLREAARPMRGAEIRDAVRDKWWPDCPKDWKSTPFGFIQSGKLIKNADGLFEIPKPRAPPAPPNTGHAFEHGGKSVVLPIKEWRVVSRLYAVMASGGGMLDFKALADHAFKGDAGRAIDPRMWLRDIETTVNVRLAPLGLTMVAVSVMPNGPKAGYVLRAVET